MGAKSKTYKEVWESLSKDDQLRLDLWVGRSIIRGVRQPGPSQFDLLTEEQQQCVNYIYKSSMDDCGIR